MSRNDHLIDRLRTGSIDRRHLVGGAAGIATAATAAVALGSLVSAQSAATATATPGAGSGSTKTKPSATDRAAAVIASVQADRDALASKIDASKIDELLSLAKDLNTKAQAAPDTADQKSSSGTPAAGGAAGTPSRRQYAKASIRTAKAARAMIVGQLVLFGLPSEEASVSQDLANVHSEVKAVTTQAASSKIEDVPTLVTHAQAAYKSAFDAFHAKTYASADAYGDAASDLAEAAGDLLGMDDHGEHGESKSGGKKKGNGSGSGDTSQSGDNGSDSNDESQSGDSGSDSSGESQSGDNGSTSPDGTPTPVTVPEPTF